LEEVSEMPKLRTLFAAVDETEHVYTWDYSKQESASELFDVGPDSFALITTCHEVDEETGAMLDLRVRDFTRCRLYSKRTLQVTETFDMKPANTLPELQTRPWGSRLRKAESIQLPTGRAFIADGNLVLEEGSSTVEHAS
jgi:hypothetical protein